MAQPTSALACTLLETVRRVGLKGIAFAQIQYRGMRLKLSKIGTLVYRTRQKSGTRVM